MQQRRIQIKLTYWMMLLSLSFLLLGVGCTSQRHSLLPLVTAEEIGFENLREKVNARSEGVTQFRGSVHVSLRYVDAKGKSQFEDGDGILIYRGPRDLSLTLGKIGQNAVKLGSNDRIYWVMYLRGKPAAYLGRHGGPGEAEFPIPVLPQDLITLTGVLTLPEAVIPQLYRVDQNTLRLVYPEQTLDERYCLVLEMRESDGRLLKMTVYPNLSAYEAEQRLLVKNAEEDQAPERKDYFLLTCEYGAEEVFIEDFDQPKGAWKTLSDRINIYAPQGQVRMKLGINHLTTGPVKDRFFDFLDQIDLYDIDRVYDMDRAAIEKARRTAATQPGLTP